MGHYSVIESKSMNAKKLSALRALNRALANAEEAGIIAALGSEASNHARDRFQQELIAMARSAQAPMELSTWTVIYGAGLHFTCEAEDIHHAVELCEYAYPGEPIFTAFQGETESQVEVEHWDSPCYGGAGEEGAGGEVFVVGTLDRREVSGKFDVTMAPVDGYADDLLYVMFEVNRLPGSKDDSQCVHIHFDSENLAMSVYKQGNKFILRPENGVTVLNTVLPTGEKALVVQ